MNSKVLERAHTKTLVEPKDRLNALPLYFGAECAKFEKLVYTYMGEFCSEYDDGPWDFYTLSNGGFFMSYDCGGEDLDVSFSENYFEGIMSAEALSIGVNLCAISLFAREDNNEMAAGLYYALRDYAEQHAEGRKIMRLID